MNAAATAHAGTSRLEGAAAAERKSTEGKKAVLYLAAGMKRNAAAMAAARIDRDSLSEAVPRERLPVLRGGYCELAFTGSRTRTAVWHTARPSTPRAVLSSHSPFCHTTAVPCSSGGGIMPPS